MNKSDLSLNLNMLKGPLASMGYDKWRHQFTGYNKETGAEKTFFVEYFVLNPAIRNGHPIMGQLPTNQAIGRRPSYALVKVGAWGEQAKQLHNFYSFSDVRYANDYLHLTIGSCELSERHLKGSCSVSESDSVHHPEYMSDAGVMTWDLQINKKIAVNFGKGLSKISRKFHALETFWHAEGVRTEYSGSIEFDGIKYDVFPESSFGYADKNWGSTFTSPWIWLSGCHLISTTTGKTLENAAFVVKSVLQHRFGRRRSQKLYGGLCYEGKMQQYNQLSVDFEEGESKNLWRVKAENKKTVLILELSFLKNEMLFLNYEAPDGTKNHNRLWSGGDGRGSIEFYAKTKKGNHMIDQFEIRNVGCEYGVIDT